MTWLPCVLIGAMLSSMFWMRVVGRVLDEHLNDLREYNEWLRAMVGEDDQSPTNPAA